ncbi:MAG: class I SAM-dependent methyltransferase [Archaeoglobi archaeon]|nr:class I SAM-dependent methyltransferase [Archaeoglobi archaeon]
MNLQNRDRRERNYEYTKKLDYTIYYSIWHKTTEEYVEKLAKIYIKDFSRLFKKFKISNKNLKILDVGAGFGFCVYALNKMGYDALGIDINPQMVDVAKKLGIKVELIEDTISWLFNNPEKFDVIIAFDVLEHVPVIDEYEFCRAIYHSLKKPGVLIAQVPNANASFACRFRYNDFTHCNSFTEHSIYFLLKNAGFEEIEVEEIKPELRLRPRPFLAFILLKFFRFLRRLEAVAEFGSYGFKMPLSLNIRVVAWKK